MTQVFSRNESEGVDSNMSLFLKRLSAHTGSYRGSEGGGLRIQAYYLGDSLSIMGHTGRHFLFILGHNG